jgi:ATP dependent DNA ligase domain
MPLPSGFVPPCLPTKAPQPPADWGWLHEIKHDGFRVIARKTAGRVRLYSRPGNDLTERFSLIVEAVARLRARSLILDGEAVACDAHGMPSFARIRYRRHDGSVFLYAFDLLELNGDDLRRDPLEVRKATLASVLAKAAPRPAPQRAHRGRRTDRVRPRLQAGLGGDRVEAQGLALPLRTVSRLAEGQEPRLCGGEARGRGRLGPLRTRDRARGARLSANLVVAGAVRSSSAVAAIHVSRRGRPCSRSLRALSCALRAHRGSDRSLRFDPMPEATGTPAPLPSREPIPTDRAGSLPIRSPKAVPRR